MFKTYYTLTKPGIVYGNALPAIAGFLLASKGHNDFWLLLATLAGISLVIASGCVLNNYIDQGIDRRMARTKNRALAAGRISNRQALIYAAVLGLAGFLLLAIYTNLLTIIIGIVALCMYVVVYGIAKRRSVHGTLIGSIPGAAAPVAGYTAVSGHVDGGALLLFLILALWQMPHFYAIAIFRAKEYAAARIPVLPVKKGIPATKYVILFYTAAFVCAACALSLYGYTGKLYLTFVGAAGAIWLLLGVRGLRATDDIRWARQMFFFSLIVLTVLCLMIAIDPVLP